MASVSGIRPQQVGADQHGGTQHKEGDKSPDPAPVSRRVCAALDPTLIRKESPTDQNDDEVHRQAERDEGEGPIVFEVAAHRPIVSRQTGGEAGFLWAIVQARRPSLRPKYRL
jgi:hypothetical protein